MENLIRNFAPLLLLFCNAFMVCMFLIDRKSLNIKRAKQSGMGSMVRQALPRRKEIDEAFKRIRYEPQAWRGNYVKVCRKGIIIGCNMMQLGKRKQSLPLWMKAMYTHWMIARCGRWQKTAKVSVSKRGNTAVHQA